VGTVHERGMMMPLSMIQKVINRKDKTIEAQRARIAELEDELERWKTSFRDVQIEEMVYTMREVAALGIDFDKEIVSDGNALHDVVMARISVLRDTEKQLAAMTEGLTCPPVEE
jgi:hypothetical protein